MTTYSHPRLPHEPPNDRYDHVVPGAHEGGLEAGAKLSATDPRYAILFESVQIGPKVAPNRFYVSPYSPSWGMHQLKQKIAHRAMRAEGGWGVVNTGECSFGSDSDQLQDLIWLRDDKDAEALSELVDAVHAHGSLAGVELAHHGAWSEPTRSRSHAVAPSQLATDTLPGENVIPKAMEKADIRRVQRGFVEAARRARTAGFDLVYVLAAWSYLPIQFMSPFYNQRTDEYGGSFDNRCRFLLETLEMVREAIGDDCGIPVRLSIDALGPAGIRLDEALEFVSRADHLVDLWDLVVGGLGEKWREMTPSRLFDEGANQELKNRVREVTAKPIAATGRWTNPDRMVQLVRSGKVDLISAARPGIADPFMPRKIAEGRIEELRECIGSNECVRRGYTRQIACSQNPTIGEEGRRGWHPELFTLAKNRTSPALVVGAGPAGLECAVVMARRGFEAVHVAEARSRTGGRLNWFSKLPGFAPWRRVAEHRESWISRLRSVEAMTEMRMTVDDILDYGAEIVVVATGSRWATLGVDYLTQQPIPGADAREPFVLTPEQILLDEKPLPGRRIAVYDCEADITAVGMAQYLQSIGCEVTVVSPFADIAHRASLDAVGPTIRAEILRDGGQLMPSATLRSVEPDGISTSDVLGREQRLEVDGLVLISHRLSDDSLYHDLVSDPARLAEANVRSVLRAGDCISPRSISDAVFDGHRLAREIDSANPAEPLPLLFHDN